MIKPKDDDDDYGDEEEGEGAEGEGGATEGGEPAGDGGDEEWISQGSLVRAQALWEFLFNLINLKHIFNIYNY